MTRIITHCHAHPLLVLAAQAEAPTPMACRPGCGACCIAPSISSAIPGLPRGKPAGQRCPHLGEARLCALFGQAERPAVCVAFRASQEMCGSRFEEALAWLSALEQATRPA